MTTGGGTTGGSVVETCKGCGRTISGTDWTCPHCGKTRWPMVIGTTVVGLIGIGVAAAPDAPTWLRIVAGVLGGLFSLVGVSEIRTGLRSRQPGTPGSSGDPGSGPAATGPVRDRARRGPLHWGAAGTGALAVAAVVMGAVWNGQHSVAIDERDGLLAEVAAAEERLAEVNGVVAGLESGRSDLEAEAATARSRAADLNARAADIEAGVAERAAVFDADTADQTALAAAMAEFGTLLRDLAELDRLVAEDLDDVAQQFARGVTAGNRRNVDGLAAAVDAEALARLTEHLDAATSALDQAAEELAALPESLPAVQEDGDGG